MPLRLFKKKDGSKSALGKLAAGVGKGVKAVVTAVPKAVKGVKAGFDKLGHNIRKANRKVKDATGGEVALENYLPEEGENLKDYGKRIVKGAGAGTAAFFGTAKKRTNSKDPFKDGFTEEVIFKYVKWAALGLLTVVVIKKVL